MIKKKVIVTMHWKIPQAAKDYFDQHKDIYLPVFAGGRKTLEATKDKWLLDNCIADDDYKDNISELNPILNENTTMYLVHKNLRAVGDAADIGHVHYRRFFDTQHLPAVDTCDGVVANRIVLGVVGCPVNVQKQYELCHKKEDFGILKQTVKEAGLLNEDAWNEWQQQPFLLAPCNCNVLKREVWNMYTKDLFNILLRLVHKIDLNDRDDYQKRACGFLSERYTSYWMYSGIKEGKLRLIELPLTEHLDWKPEGSGDSRGSYAGQFLGDKTWDVVNQWLKSRK